MCIFIFFFNPCFAFDVVLDNEGVECMFVCVCVFCVCVLVSGVSTYVCLCVILRMIFVIVIVFFLGLVC